MTIPCSLYPLGTMIGPYRLEEVVCDVSNGESKTKTLTPGIYYIRGQGAGGKGGNYGYPYFNGNGAPSGAGFVGFIRIKKTITVTVTAGVGGTPSHPAGTDTTISGIMVLGGGSEGPQTGYNTVCPAGTPGKITIYENEYFSVVSYTVNSDGNPGCHHDGGNSVITNDGAGSNTGAATKPGAGGGGTSSIGGTGGNGGYGECLIKFTGFY